MLTISACNCVVICFLDSISSQTQLLSLLQEAF